MLPVNGFDPPADCASRARYEAMSWASFDSRTRWVSIWDPFNAVTSVAVSAPVMTLNKTTTIMSSMSVNPLSSSRLGGVSRVIGSRSTTGRRCA